MPKTLALIPARSGSKGVPNKNIRLLNSRPLVYYTLDMVISNELIDTVCVSTNDLEIQKIVNDYNSDLIVAPFLRPENLSTDSSPTLPAIQHALDYYEGLGIVYDAVLLLQPTVPLRSTKTIKIAIEKFYNSNADSLISVRDVPHNYNPHWVFEPKDNFFVEIVTGEKEPIPRRQELPRAFHRDGSIYITKVETIRKGSLYGDSISYLLNLDSPHFNIDTLEDWVELENYFTRIIS
jgi:N-acylneuraminate cytidylyltransferase